MILSANVANFTPGMLMLFSLRAAIGKSAESILVMALCAGCASTPQAPPPPDEGQLVAAGFKVVDAKTVQQQEHLQALPQGRVSGWQRTGTMFYVYPDLAKKQLYVGTPKAYEAYRQVVPASGPTLAQQHAADMASYNKTDARMSINTNNDLTDPWSLWGDVEGLGGR